MNSLIYPLEPAENLPKLSADNYKKKPEQKVDRLPVIDEQGFVIAQAGYDYIQQKGDLLHPVIHLYIINRFEELYLVKKHQKEEKADLPKWDFASSSLVLYGEELEEALFRTVKQNLNLSDFNPIFLKSYIEKDEYINIFAIIGKMDISVNQDIIKEGRFFSISNIEENLGKSIFKTNLEQEFIFIKQSLLSLL